MGAAHDNSAGTHYSLTATHSPYPSWPAPEPAISISGTMVPMYADGRVKPGYDDRATDKSGSVSFGITSLRRGKPRLGRLIAMAAQLGTR